MSDAKQSTEINVAIMLEGGTVKFVEEVAQLAAAGMIGMAAVGSRQAPAAAFVVAGHAGLKVFDKIMEIVPTLPEYKGMIEAAEAMSAQIEAAKKEKN